MRLTTKGRFAVTAMIDIGLRRQLGPVNLAAISQRQQISLSYLEQLFGKLRKHNLVESVRGPGGGYRLARHSADISVADIIAAVDERAAFGNDADDADDLSAPGASSSSLARSTEELWASLNQRMLDFLRTVTLQKLVEDQVAKGAQLEAPTPAKRAITSPAPVKPLRTRAPNSVFALANAMSKH
ncbi:DNA-binding protein [Variovorax paradoxus]|jgi:Rrf2 family transcriptional regulator, iron-sulfur cluster assembly transcription factor|uniref:Rrf2 family transcriptional regulator n=1 Tax=Variovorax paradoxus TaxID=34073 RepID=UPI0006E660CA|nr:DNA-binding protein [Variovorax paradoxus]KPU95739.1 DNA-binding protein [Variovorax paradoxus]KPU97827.1 DNA-binding protein [Variovorax paradoxus]KPV15567.1 DNA-binding protein [Variovorax paradoxus]KPV23811.1 DNA-binding protein [Variovorax paradoxus]